jgi:hypothetical protein
MKMNKINYAGMVCNSVDYSGVQIVQNPLTGSWMLFFDNKYPDQLPYSGTLTAMKAVVNTAVRKGGEGYFIKAGTYK